MIVTIVNAGFLVVAMSVATALAAPAKQARATATVLSGVTLFAGVPPRAMLGDWSGWRSAFWAVAALVDELVVEGQGELGDRFALFRRRR